MTNSWDSEPNELDWIDEETGFHCSIKRHPEFGHLCGYVTTPENHPLRIPELDNWTTVEPYTILEVHGGITYNENGVLGFDCAHLSDYKPWFQYNFDTPPENYRTIEYVKEQVKRLAKQIQDAPSWMKDKETYLSEFYSNTDRNIIDMMNKLISLKKYKPNDI